MATDETQNLSESQTDALNLVQSEIGIITSSVLSAVTPGSSLSLVQKEVGPVEATQLLDAYKAVNDAIDRRAVLEILDTQNGHDRTMRKSVAYSILAGLGIEILVANVLLFFQGFGLVTFSDEWFPRIFFVGVLTQVVAVLTLVAKNLFPERKSDTVADIVSIFEKF